MHGLSRIEIKGVPIPVSFAVMVAAIVALAIFFGAWAVSAGAEERERSKAGIAGGGANLDAGPINPSLPAGQRTLTVREGGGSKADTWWGKTLLKACPLH